ncbi:MAG TPA: hypothetical protein PLS70_04255 [Acidobacteriota bacterium]|nr:hypothetical protein [Acidobacteriota bacterium]
MVTITESGLIFGPYPENECFLVEKSATYQNIQSGVKMAEFLRLQRRDSKPPLILVIEAKSSSPRPETEPNFTQYIDEIREKLTNGLVLTIASILRRHEVAQRELSQEFKDLDLATCEFRLILVINGHKKEWLPPLNDALTLSLHSTIKTWALGATSVMVLNEEMASKLGLTCTPSSK